VLVFDLVWVAHADKLELRPDPNRGRHSEVQGRCGSRFFLYVYVLINVRRYMLVIVVDKLCNRQLCLVHS
jgi:uncharacterized protein YqhQ